MIKDIHSKLDANIVLIFMVYLFMQPILDLSAGILLNIVHLSLPISALVRMLFFCFAIYYLWFINKERNKPYLIVLFIYSCFYVLGILLFKESSVLASEVKMMLNTLYLPIVLLFCLRIFARREFKEKNILKVLFIYLVFVFIPNLFQVGFSSYEYAKVGSAGFFYSANAVGSILSILIPFVVCYYLTNKKVIKLILILFLYFYALLSMGTKAPLLCSFIIIFYYIVLGIIKLIKQKNYKILGVFTILIIAFIMGIVFLIPHTPFYENILIHLDFLEIHTIKDFFSFKALDRFIFSDRLSFLKDNIEFFNNVTIYQRCFGIGYTINGLELKIVEMDYLDMLLSHGIIGFFVLYSLYFKVLFRCMKNYFKNFKDNFFNIRKSSLMISLIISILCALLTGHVLSTPAVVIYVIIILVLTLKENEVIQNA